jgi:hypothetical protein
MKTFLKYFLIFFALWFAIGASYSYYLTVIGFMTYSWPKFILASAWWPWLMIFFTQSHAIHFISYSLAMSTWFFALWISCKSISKLSMKKYS